MILFTYYYFQFKVISENTIRFENDIGIVKELTAYKILGNRCPYIINFVGKYKYVVFKEVFSIQNFVYFLKNREQPNFYEAKREYID